MAYSGSNNDNNAYSGTDDESYARYSISSYYLYKHIYSSNENNDDTEKSENSTYTYGTYYTDYDSNNGNNDGTGK